VLKKLLFGAAAAGAVAWLSKNQETAKAYVNRYAGQLKGAAGSVTPGVGRAPVEERLNDPALAQKVESEVFRDEQIPKGNVSVNVEEGVVYLRGALPSEDVKSELASRARAVDGVRGVEDLTHVG
jgi:osmotically-inducible protein OsmY